MSNYNIVDFLAGAGQDNSFSGRKKLAASLGISNYKGTAQQNLAMLSSLKKYQNYNIPTRPSDYGQSSQMPMGINSDMWNSSSHPLTTNSGYGMPSLQYQNGGMNFGENMGMDNSELRNKYWKIPKKQQGGNTPFVEDNIDDFDNAGENDGDYDDKQDWMQKGGIKIKKSNKGKFTAYKKKTGKTTQEALHSSDPRVKKMAVFAANAAKWKH